MSSRIGIYAGTFDPVHAGHIAFALQAMRRAKLDRVYFVPERRPRQKAGVEHFAHRAAMLRRAALPHPDFDVLELEDVSFSVEYTLPRLRRRFANDQLVFLFGSDTARQIIDWPLAERLLRRDELVVGVRQRDNLKELEAAIGNWPVRPKALTIFESHSPAVSSRKIRESLRSRRPVSGLLSSVKRYSAQHWLYISLARPSVVDKP